MTKLVIVLAVVVVVILVVVFVAVRNMRAEDPDEFADRPSGRGGSRGSRDDRDPRYDRREPAERQPARASRGSRPAGRQAANGHRPAASAARGSDDRRDDGYDRPRQNGRGYDEDGDFDQRRSRGKDAQRRLEESHASARSRQAGGRRSDDSSEWEISDWEKLSDVDYWTELAADKPLTTTAQPAAQAGPGRPRADREADTAAMPAPLPAAAGSVPTVAGGVPRRDPATGLPVRGRPQPDDAEPLAATDGRGGFAAAPILPAAAEDQFRPPARQADFGPAPVSAAAAEGQLRPLAEPRPSRPGGSAGFPGPVRGVSADRPPVDPDDDPLTSPSFPRVPAADSRSYHSGRASSTPPRGTRVPEGPLAPTQQFTSYGSPVSPRAAGRHAGPADLGGDTDRTSPHSYLPDPLLNGDPYAAPNGDPYPAPNGDRYPAHNGEGYPVRNGDPYPAPSGDPYPGRSASAPAAPAPAAPPPPASPRTSGPTTPASGNPYGSYVTSDSQDTAFGYDDYPSVPGNGHGSYLPSSVPGSPADGSYLPSSVPGSPADGSYLPSPVPGGSTGRHAGNGHRPRQQPSSPADLPAPAASGYPAHRRDPRHAGAPAADYRNGYGQHDQAGYLPGGYPAGSPNPAGYGLPDPYRRDGYNGYPEYGTTEN